MKRVQTCWKVPGWLLCIFFLVCSAGCGQKEEWLSFEKEAEIQEEAGAGQLPIEEKREDFFAEEEKHRIYVDIEGAVQNPGVYELEEGSRVYQVIEAAGSFRENAQREQVNQARLLSDGEQIWIFTREEWAEMEARGEKQPGASALELSGDLPENPLDGKINLNTADMTELMTLPGIGEAKARAILSYRESNGRFQSIEEVMHVEGIKEGVFQKIKEQIVAE